MRMIFALALVFSLAWTAAASAQEKLNHLSADNSPYLKRGVGCDIASVDDPEWRVHAIPTSKWFSARPDVARHTVSLRRENFSFGD
jgi:hypothetical protein